jgi:hypothetical protein
VRKGKVARDLRSEKVATLGEVGTHAGEGSGLSRPLLQVEGCETRGAIAQR